MFHILLLTVSLATLAALPALAYFALEWVKAQIIEGVEGEVRRQDDRLEMRERRRRDKELTPSDADDPAQSRNVNGPHAGQPYRG